MALTRSPLSVPIILVAAFSLASCSSARLDPLEFDYYSSTGDPAKDELANPYPVTPITPARREIDPVAPLGPVSPVAAPASVAPASAASVTVHELQRGESLYGLSVRYLGTGRRWREIARLNGLSDADVRRLPVGRKIRIPAR